MSGRSLFYLREYGLVFVMSIVASVPLFSSLERRIQMMSRKLQAGYHIATMLMIAVLFYVAVVYTVNVSYNPFILF